MRSNPSPNRQPEHQPERRPKDDSSTRRRQPLLSDQLQDNHRQLLEVTTKLRLLTLDLDSKTREIEACKEAELISVGPIHYLLEVAKARNLVNWTHRKEAQEKREKESQDWLRKKEEKLEKKAQLRWETDERCRKEEDAASAADRKDLRRLEKVVEGQRTFWAERLAGIEAERTSLIDNINEIKRKQE